MFHYVQGQYIFYTAKKGHDMSVRVSFCLKYNSTSNILFMKIMVYLHCYWQLLWG